MDILLYVLKTSAFFWIASFLLFGLMLIVFNSITRIFIYIHNDEYGVVERLWSFHGSIRSGIIVMEASAGYLPDTIRGGPHFFVPFQYRVHREKLITVRGLGYIFARDGVPLPAGQTLAATPAGVSFEDARAFLLAGGQRGPQRAILREGVYAINTALFAIFTDDGEHYIDIGDDNKTVLAIGELIQGRGGYEPIVIGGDNIGVVTVHDGPSMEYGAVIAPTVGMDRSDPNFHNLFQNIDAFLAANGTRGRQEQPLVEGTYFINRLFATVELSEKTSIAIGNVGVVVSYTGATGADVSGTDYRHGSLVLRGQRGVWQEPLPPGKYPFNPLAYKVIQVPTTNFVLRWIEGRREDHGLDANLSEIRLITKDKFEPILPLSVVVHISPENAPRLIQQFADVKRLVDQTVDPMVSAYFKDVAQKLTMLELIDNRAALQAEAKEVMRDRFRPYDLELMEVMIGTPRAAVNDTRIPALMDQIRDRQLAVEQQQTYITQGSAAREQQNLNMARAAAERQTMLTESEIEVQVRENEGKAELAMRTQQASAIRITAEAEAFRTTQEGNGEASRIRAVGEAEGSAIRAKVDAFTGDGAAYQLQQTIATILGDAIQNSPKALVPEVLIVGNGADKADGIGPGSSMIQALLAMALTTRGSGRAINGSGAPLVENQNSA